MFWEEALSPEAQSCSSCFSDLVSLADWTRQMIKGFWSHVLRSLRSECRKRNDTVG